MADQSHSKRQNTEKILLDVVKTLRSHPEQYQEVRQAIRDAKSDEERVRQLLHYATTDQQLASLLPASARTGDASQELWITITVTTVLIPGDAY